MFFQHLKTEILDFYVIFDVITKTLFVNRSQITLIYETKSLKM